MHYHFHCIIKFPGKWHGAIVLWKKPCKTALPFFLVGVVCTKVYSHEKYENKHSAEAKVKIEKLFFK